MLSCPICRKSYDSERHRPVVGICGHTICCHCRSSLINRSCPVSNDCYFLPSAFILCTTNFKIMEFVEENQRVLRESRRTREERRAKKCELAEKLQKEGEERTSGLERDLHEIEESILEIENELKNCQEERRAFENKEKLEFRKVARLPKCSQCSDRMYKWQALCCFTCNEGIAMKEGETVIADMKKAEEGLICGECVLTSEHKKHAVSPLLKYQISARVKERCRPYLEKVQRLVVGVPRAPQIVEEINRQGVDAVEARSIEDADRIIDLLIKNCEMALKVLEEKKNASNESFRRYASFGEEKKDGNDSIVIVEEFVASPPKKSLPQRPALSNIENMATSRRKRSQAPKFNSSKRPNLTTTQMDDVIVID